MEPVDPRMGGLLGGGDPADPVGGGEDLRAIVARAGRRMRLRAGALAGAVSLVVGGGAGYAISTTGGSGNQVVATSKAAGGNTAAAAPSASQASGETPSYAVGGTSKFTRLFTRQANGVDIRAFLVESPLMVPLGAAGSTASPSCSTVSRLQAELSTPDMVAVAGGGGFVGQQSGQNIIDVEPQLVGAAEGDQVSVVVVLTGPAVAEVRMTFATGKTDEMAPREGWSVLAAPDPSLQSGKTAATTLGTLTALGQAGATLATQAITWPPGPTPLPGGSGGSSGSGSGTAGPGTVGSGGAVNSVQSVAQAQAAAAAAAAAAARTAVEPCGNPPPGIPCPRQSLPSGAAYACPLTPLPVVTTPYRPPSASPSGTVNASGG